MEHGKSIQNEERRVTDRRNRLRRALRWKREAGKLLLQERVTLFTLRIQWTRDRGQGQVVLSYAARSYPTSTHLLPGPRPSDLPVRNHPWRRCSRRCYAR